MENSTQSPMKDTVGNNVENRSLDDQASVQTQLLRQQVELQTKQVRNARITNICMLILVAVFVVAMVTVVPKVDKMLDNVNQIADNLEEGELHDVVENINSLAQSSQTGVEEATEKLQQIDLEALNQGIKDLNSVIKPLADFFGNFQ